MKKKLCSLSKQHILNGSSTLPQNRAIFLKTPIERSSKNSMCNTKILTLACNTKIACVILKQHILTLGLYILDILMNTILVLYKELVLGIYGLEAKKKRPLFRRKKKQKTDIVKRGWLLTVTWNKHTTGLMGTLRKLWKKLIYKIISAGSRCFLGFVQGPSPLVYYLVYFMIKNFF